MGIGVGLNSGLLQPSSSQVWGVLIFQSDQLQHSEFDQPVCQVGRQAVQVDTVPVEDCWHIPGSAAVAPDQARFSVKIITAKPIILGLLVIEVEIDLGEEPVSQSTAVAVFVSHHLHKDDRQIRGVGWGIEDAVKLETSLLHFLRPEGVATHSRRSVANEFKDEGRVVGKQAIEEAIGFHSQGRCQPNRKMSEFYRSSVELANLFTLSHCMSHLKLKSDDCSPLGKLLLEYVEQHPGINLSKLAKETGMSRPGLGWVCLKHTNPNEETAEKLAIVLKIEEWEVARLVHQNKLENLDNLTPIETAVAGKCLDEIFEALRDLEQTLYRESFRQSDFQVYRQAFEAVKSRLLLPDRSSESKASISVASIV